MSKITKTLTASLAVALALAALPALGAHADDNAEMRAIITTPAARLADVDYGLVMVAYPTASDDEQLYVWSTYYGAAFSVVTLASDDLYDLGATPAGTQIKFAVEGGLGTVTLLNQGYGIISGDYNGLTFSFHSEAAQNAVYDGGWPRAMTLARPAALTALGRTQEAAIAQAVLTGLPR